MTIGELSRRTGMSLRALRRYEGMGLIYTAGRSAGNYRLFDESALWCVEVVRAGPVVHQRCAAGLLRHVSMLLAAVRGYAGCEVLAVSNWLLGRDDQLGRLVLSPIDRLDSERRRAGSGPD